MTTESKETVDENTKRGASKREFIKTLAGLGLGAAMAQTLYSSLNPKQRTQLVAWAQSFGKPMTYAELGRLIDAAAWDDVVRAVRYQPASYIVYQAPDGSYQAKNGNTGQIEFSGTDAASVIQWALNLRGTILVKKGVYTISSKLFAYGGTRLLGETGAILKLNNTVDINLLEVNGDDFEMAGFGIDGSRTGALASNLILALGKRHYYHDLYFHDADNGCLYLVNVQDCIVRNIYAKNTDAFIVGSPGADAVNVLIDGVFGEDTGMVESASVHIVGATGHTVERIEIKNIFISRVSASTISPAVDITSASNVIIDGLISIGCNKGVNSEPGATDPISDNIQIYNFYIKNSTYEGIKLVAGGLNTITNIKIANGLVDGTGANYNGIQLSGAEAEVTNVAVKNAGGDGISFNKESRRARVLGCRIENVNYVGIILYAATYGLENCIITDNIIKNCGQINPADYRNGVGIRLYNVGFSIVKNNIIYDGQATPTTTIGIKEDGASDFNTIIDNKIRNMKYRPVIETAGANTVVKFNVGYVTESKGIATLAAGSTSVVVNHGLTAAPNSIKITPQANVGAPWVTNVTATSFTINVATAPAAAVNFYWEAEV